ncbi:MAG: hypothetical protein NC821_05140, partial [Candidatus Omnitrophica bacterium]|nr:hypothetical protein [Candidatus Omnitrophota bacterium]
ILFQRLERGHGGIQYLTSFQRLLKLQLESSFKENKVRNLSSDAQTVENRITLTPNHFVTELVSNYN